MVLYKIKIEKNLTFRKIKILTINTFRLIYPYKIVRRYKIEWNKMVYNINVIVKTKILSKALKKQIADQS